MAKWRRRIYRGIVASLVSGVAATGWLIYQTTSSAAVRQQVISHLRQRFTGAEVALGSAKLRLLGGITFSNLTLYRRDDPSQTPFLHVPAGVIHHDKEQLGQGRMVIRKITFERPRLTVLRNSAGQWNLAGILGPVRPEMPIPVFEFVQGTVAFDIAETPTPGADPLPPNHIEWRHVNGTLLNHPLALLNFDLAGHVDSLGPLALRGTWHRAQEDLTATLDLAPVALGSAAQRQLSRLAPGVVEPIDQLSGEGVFHVDLRYRADASPAWHHQVRAEVTKGRFVHRSLPFPIENLQLVARCDDGNIVIETASGTSGPARFAAKARLDMPRGPKSNSNPSSAPAIIQIGAVDTPAKTPHPESLLSAWIEPFRSLEFTLSDWPVTPELFDRLPATFAVYRQRFAPTGMLDVAGKFNRTAIGWAGTISLLPTDMSFRFDAFPYPLKQVRGRLDLALAAHQPPRLDVDLTAEGNQHRPVTIRGYVAGNGPDPEYAYDLGGSGLPIDESLVLSLPSKFQNVARSFHVQGICDIAAKIRRAAGTSLPRQDYQVQLRDSSLCYDIFPAPLDHVTGTLDIHLAPAGDSNGTYFEFRNFRANRGGGQLRMNGSARPSPNGTQIELGIHGDRVPLDEALGSAFARMRLRTIWDMLAPCGRMDFDVDYTHRDNPNGPPDFTLAVTPRGATIRPSFFPYTLTDFSGSFRATRTRVELENFSARHGVTQVQVAGGAIVMNNGGYRADLGGIVAAPLPMDEDLGRACPAALQTVIRTVQPRGTLAVELSRLIIDEPSHLPGPGSQPILYWDARVNFADASLRTGVEWTDVTGVIACQGRYSGHALERVLGHIALDRASVFRQPLTNLHARVVVDEKSPNVIQVENVAAGLYGGQLGGQARVTFGSGLQYGLYLAAVGAQLDEFARQNRMGNAHLSGAARAELYLTGAGSGIDELEGAATVHVPNGKIYNLPVFLDLLKVLGLHSPDGTAFEEGHLEVAIHGRKLDVQRLDLLGNALSLGGRGELNLDGSDLKLDFYAVWGHIVQMLPVGLREIPPWLSKNLFKITARGQLGGKINYAMEPVPGVVDPVRQLMDRIQKRSNEAMSRGPQGYTPRLKGN